ncbi:MAG: efflux RND transporter periplasmic adaptor subunit, partial [bacterium]
MIKRHFFLVAAIVLLGLMIVAVVLRMAFSGDEKSGGGPGGGGGAGGGRGQAVSEAVIATRPFTDEIRVLGVARGRRSVNITSSTSELITRVLFTDGQRVAAGTPLVELQAREEDAGIIEARAQVAQAQRQFDRYKTLADRGIAPRVTVEDAETALATAQASLTAAQARRGDRLIRAPFAGVLGLSSVTAGTLVNPGGVITTLDDIDVVRVDFPVPERYLGVLRAGTP